MSPSSAPAPTFKRPLRAFLAYVRRLFSLREDTDYENTVVQIKANVDFKRGNLWALVFAILIASVGLDVNSTAVIIGAMLISPLMGPIIGAGLALGLNDVELLRRALRNLAVASVVSILTSALYFAISPLAGAQSELLARIHPTVYDVLIATFGGAVGAVALSRKGDTGNLLPGVAIATALMPPLCTAGYGLAEWNFEFILGALYLFIINALFIGLSTLAVVRLLGFRRVAYLDPRQAVRNRAIIALLTVAAIVPSVVVAVHVVRQSRFESAARQFAAEHLVFPDRSVLNLETHYERGRGTISVTILGEPLDAETIRSLEQRLSARGLAGTRLEFRQQAGNQSRPDQLTRMVREGIIEDLYKRHEQTLAERDSRIRSLEAELARFRASDLPVKDLAGEIGALFPTLYSVSIGPAIEVQEPVATPVINITAIWNTAPTPADQEKLRNFLKLRLKTERLRLINDQRQ